MTWEIKQQVFELQYKSGDEKDTRFEDLNAVIAHATQDGWEPWAMDIKHNFNRDYSVLITLANVWFKRPK